jgi:hypothetical protein
MCSPIPWTAASIQGLCATSLCHPLWFLTIESLIACSPYTSQSWLWMSAGFVFLSFKKRITDRISHVAGFSIFLNILNTGRCVNVIRMSANWVRDFQKDQQTLHAWAPWWPQCCSSNICKRNLFCGYAWYVLSVEETCVKVSNIKHTTVYAWSA